MYLDLMCADSFGRFNRKLAKLTTLQTAVYWSEIVDIMAKVAKKKTLDENGFFKLDREYVEQRTGISIDEQLFCDSYLERLSVLIRDTANPAKISVDLSRMASVLVDDNIKKLDAPKGKIKLTAEEKAASRRAGQRIGVKRTISEQDPDLKEKYENWVDSVYDRGDAGDKRSFLNGTIVKSVEDSINGFTTDKNVKLAILDELIRTGYTTAKFAIEHFSKQGQASGTRINSEQKVLSNNSEVFTF